MLDAHHALDTSMPDVVLEAENLSMQFGGVQALANVSLKVRRNELRCLIGPNGAGKSTFFRCISSQYLPTSGEVWVAGERTTGLPVHALARRGVGLKTQVPSLMNALSGAENLWLGARAVRARSPTALRHAVDAVVHELGLAPFLGRPAGLLSHGQRQLLELGVVLGAEPWLLLLDEPAGGLTHDEVDHMAALMLRLRQRMTIMVVEHDMSFVRQLGSQVTVFHQGAVLTEGPVEQVLCDDRVRAIYLGKKAV
jgi:branched-chain amino acid transport system ATP-binding protein